MTAEAIAVVECKHDAALLGQLAFLDDQQLAAHAQVEQQPAAAGIHLDRLAVVSSRVNLSIPQGRAEYLGRQVEALGLEDIDGGDAFVGQALVELVSQGGNSGSSGMLGILCAVRLKHVGERLTHPAQK